MRLAAEPDEEADARCEGDRELGGGDRADDLARVERPLEISVGVETGPQPPPPLASMKPAKRPRGASRRGAGPATLHHDRGRPKTKRVTM